MCCAEMRIVIYHVQHSESFYIHEFSTYFSVEADILGFRCDAIAISRVSYLLTWFTGGDDVRESLERLEVTAWSPYYFNTSYTLVVYG